MTSPYSVTGGAVTWEGIRVLPGGMEMFGNDVLPGHYAYHEADLLLTLCDIYTITSDALRGMNVAHWQPVDCEPMGYADQDCLRRSGAQPVAMSRFGERMMRGAGFSPYFVPHGVDTAAFAPPADRQALRAELGVPEDMFLVGINGMNKNTRKNFPGQMAAFAKFHERHPRSALLLHTITSWKEGLDLLALAKALGISEAVKFPDQYAYVTGLLGQDMMARWYGALDLYSGATLGEGFGIPVLEAQACGTPAVVTDCSAMTELAGAGWKVPGEKVWMHLHESWWTRPDPAGLLAAYEEAWSEFSDGTAPERRQAAREFALGYDADLVTEKYWVPVLGALEGRGAVSDPAVSVCFASRGRPASLAESVRGLLDLADDPGRVEVIVAADPDDEATIRADLPPQARVWVAPQRFGYTRLHDYLNPIARMARGKWILWWNDDARMLTKGWDKVIRDAPEAILWPAANHMPHAMLFPAWPRKWSDAAGMVSPATEMDTWLQRAGEALGRLLKIPVEVFHDRCDVTGSHDDATYAEGRGRFGPDGMVGDHFPIEQMPEYVAKIRAVM